MRGWFVEISLSFSETSTAFRYLWNVLLLLLLLLLLSRFDWTIISTFYMSSPLEFIETNFGQKQVRWSIFPLGNYLIGKIFSRNHTELAKTQRFVHLFEKTSSLETLLSMVVATVIIINSVFGGFGGVDLMWLAALTVRLQVSNYSRLSHCTVRLQLYRIVSAKIKQLKEQKHLRTL